MPATPVVARWKMRSHSPGSGIVHASRANRGQTMLRLSPTFMYGRSIISAAAFRPGGESTSPGTGVGVSVEATLTDCRLVIEKLFASTFSFQGVMDPSGPSGPVGPVGPSGPGN